MFFFVCLFFHFQTLVMISKLIFVVGKETLLDFQSSEWCKKLFMQEKEFCRSHDQEICCLWWPLSMCDDAHVHFYVFCLAGMEQEGRDF